MVFGIGLFITISSVFLVANTIRLAIYAKRKIVQTMKLIGATKSFVRGPFILEGLVQGIVGGALAAGILFLVFEYLARWISSELADFVHVKPVYYGIVVVVGCVLGFLGSAISIRRFISESVVPRIDIELLFHEFFSTLSTRCRKKALGPAESTL